VTEVEDSLLDCSVVDFFDPAEDPKKVRIHAGLRVETDSAVQQIRVSSAPCGARLYKDDGSDIQEIKTLFNGWWRPNTDGAYFKQEFIRNFGDGA
jgi:hypothetical protein